jgi:hypothetical protein
VTGRLEKPPSVLDKDLLIRNGWWLRGKPEEAVGQGVHEHPGQRLVRRCRAGDEDGLESVGRKVGKRQRERAAESHLEQGAAPIR